ncbi:hypothetical protein SAMN04487894_12627 [Niabella drilacis]|uniref:Natural product n=1 Tax=Niabella drilacis (strain DSM 25811 / CCM 8410 / CCUG 62505 / LMG 26954 / E90) TaxID=1285928 RepID=A0A1G7B0L5_NIADE|nr:hypothetical protein SAMN04487894_12627 [Niabella drilacis]
MKKLKLNFQNIEGTQVLTRDQLKKILGGDGGSGASGGSGNMKYRCSCVGGAGMMHWNNMPSQSSIDNFTSNCSSGSSSCGWVNCSNPGAECPA